MTPAQMVCGHFLLLEAICEEQMLDHSFSAAEFTSTSDALIVALHYVSEHTDYPQFSAVLKQGREVQAEIRHAHKLKAAQ